MKLFYEIVIIPIQVSTSRPLQLHGQFLATANSVHGQ